MSNLEFDFDPVARGYIPPLKGFKFFDSHGYDKSGVGVTAVISSTKFLTLSTGVDADSAQIAKVDPTQARALVEFFNAFLERADEEEE